MIKQLDRTCQKICQLPYSLTQKSMRQANAHDPDSVIGITVSCQRCCKEKRKQGAEWEAEGTCRPPDISKCGVRGGERHADHLTSHHRSIQIPNKWTRATYAESHTIERTWNFSSITPWGFNYKNETQDLIYFTCELQKVYFLKNLTIHFCVMLSTYTLIHYPNLWKQHF